MILIIRQALEYLRATEIGKCRLDTVHIASEKEIRRHIMDANAGPFYSRRSAAHAICPDDVTVVGRGIHGSAILSLPLAESSFRACGTFVDEPDPLEELLLPDRSRSDTQRAFHLRGRIALSTRGLRARLEHSKIIQQVLD